jgi:hypothetical protein
MKVYPKPKPPTSEDSLDFRRVIDFVKQQADIETVGAHYGSFRPVSAGRLFGPCIGAK